MVKNFFGFLEISVVKSFPFEKKKLSNTRRTAAAALQQLQQRQLAMSSPRQLAIVALPAVATTTFPASATL